jgi:hypothetical protein
MRPDNITTLNAPERQQWKGKPLAARLNRIAKIFVEHAAVKELLAHIDAQLLIAGSRNKSTGTLVLAESGAGKSTFIKYLGKKYPDERTPEVRLRPLVHFKIPSSPTPKQMGASFLKALGDPLFRVGNAQDKKDRIAELLVTCKTRIIAIDDFQDVPARSGSHGVRDAGDWVRDICEMEEFQGTLLAFGTKEAAIVRDSNDQLGRRMMARMELPVFEIESAEGREAFRELLTAVDGVLPLALSSGLGKPELLVRIFFACGGNLDYLMKLLSQAVIRAVESNCEQLQKEHLEQGFKDLHQVAALRGNPFSSGFDAKPLDLPGQIFHRVTLEDEEKGAGKRVRKSEEN